jgi:hypothetical protein
MLLLRHTTCQLATVGILYALFHDLDTVDTAPVPVIRTGNTQADKRGKDENL